MKASGCHLCVAARQRWGQTVLLGREPPCPHLPAPRWSFCFSAPGPCRGESPWLLGPWPPLHARPPGLTAHVVSSLRCLCRDPIFFGHQDSCQVSCSDVPPPAPSSAAFLPVLHHPSRLRRCTYTSMALSPQLLPLYLTYVLEIFLSHYSHGHFILSSSFIIFPDKCAQVGGARGFGT